jgi:hypothetical protein
MYEADQVAAGEPIVPALVLLPDDEAAKRPPNAFILFCRTLRPSIRSENPDLTEVDINRILGKMWQVADEGSRGYYRDYAKQLSDEFRARHPEYEEERRKKHLPRTSTKGPEPIRLRVVLQAGEVEQTGITLADDPLTLLKIVPQSQPPELYQ